MAPTTSTEEGPYLTDLLNRLGGISGRRVLMTPPPGTATEQDLLNHLRKTGRICELVEATLVEKPMGYREGSLAAWLIRLLGRFLDEHDLGDLAGADATRRIMPQLVRIPDVSFLRWEKLPDKRLPEEPIPDLVPDLAIEVLSEGNTAGEMKRKLKEYFLAGVTLVWLVDPIQRVVTVYEAPDRGKEFPEGATLDGGVVLPGLLLPVQRIFERLTPGVPAKPRRARKKR